MLHTLKRKKRECRVLSATIFVSAASAAWEQWPGKLIAAAGGDAIGLSLEMGSRFWQALAPRVTRTGETLLGEAA